MLYLIHQANHPNLAYRDGQGPIVHLEADLTAVMDWADSENRRWAFTLSNAGAVYAEFRSERGKLGDIDWNAVQATDWRASQVKEGKQAEFLVQEFFPWVLVQRIGVHSPAVHSRVTRALAGAAHKPPVKVTPAWYY